MMTKLSDLNSEIRIQLRKKFTLVVDEKKNFVLFFGVTLHRKI